MKKKIFVLVVFAAMAVNVFAQTAFDYLTLSLSNVLEVSTIAQIADYEYREGGGLWGTYLEGGKTISLSWQYDAGVPYVILAAAHNANRDVDLKVYQGRGTGGTVVARDVAADAAPIVRFVPSSSGYYTFELINSSSLPAFVSLVILRHRTNANFSFETLIQALGNTLGISQQLVEILPRGVVSRIPPNKWALFGGNVQQGSNAGYFNSSLSSGNYILVGAGENSVTNCDVEVLEQYAYDNQSGSVISRNSGSIAPGDIGLFIPNASKYYHLKVINRGSRLNSAFLFGFLISIE